MTDIHADLLTGKRHTYFENDYFRYFNVSETPKRWRKVEPKNDAMKEATRYVVFFSFLSNDVKEAETAMALYRSGDMVEKASGSLWEIRSCSSLVYKFRECTDLSYLNGTSGGLMPHIDERGKPFLK